MAESDDPVPSAAVESRDGEQQTNTPSEESASIGDVPAPVLSLLPSNVPAAISKAHSEQREDKSVHEFSWENADWWIAGSTVVLVLVTGALAYYTKKLFRATVKLGEDADVASQARAKETAAALVEAKRSADAANDLVTDARNTAERQLRAYLTAHRITAKTIEEGKPPEIILHLRNFGNTPATNVIKKIAIEVGDKRTFDFPANRLEPVMGTSYAPNDDNELHRGAGFTLSAKTWNSLTKGGDETIFVYGEIAYSDPFKDVRRTTFRCHLVHVGGKFEFSACEGDNHIE